MSRFGRFAEPDLVRHDHTEPACSKGCSGTVPISAIEILAMQQQHRLSVRIRRLYIHKGHPELLPLYLHGIKLHRIRITVSRQIGIQRFYLLGFHGEDYQQYTRQTT